MTTNGAASAALPEMAAWSADVFAGRRVPPARAVLGPLLRRSAVTLLTGPRGVGKSWLALALAHAAARGGSLASWRAGKTHRVVYVACDPAALARDVGLLAAQGYALDAVTGYDLFPMTHHVEAVAVLTR